MSIPSQFYPPFPGPTDVGLLPIEVLMPILKIAPGDTLTYLILAEWLNYEGTVFIEYFSFFFNLQQFYLISCSQMCCITIP